VVLKGSHICKLGEIAEDWWEIKVELQSNKSGDSVNIWLQQKEKQ
jgi:hypothetical protein